MSSRYLLQSLSLVIIYVMFVSHWLGLLFIFTLIHVNQSVGRKKRAAPLRTNDIDIVSDIPEEQRTKNNWATLPIESLRLVCGQLHLNTRGNVDVLALRIYESYHPRQSLAVTSTALNTSAATTTITISPDITTTNMISDMIRQQLQAMLASPSQQHVAAVNIPSSSAPVGPPVTYIQNGAQIEQQQQYIPPASAAVDFVNNNGALQQQPLSFSAHPFQPSSASLITSQQNQISFPSQIASNPSPLQPIHFINVSDDNNSMNAFNNNNPMNAHLSSVPPAISPKLAKKIIKREYINFDLLLPDSTPAAPGQFSFSVQQSDQEEAATAVKVTPQQASSRSRVHDLSTWLLAWNNYMRTFVHHQPHMAPQLLFYQSMITQYAHTYVFDEVCVFDRNFRMRMTECPTLRWDRYDLELAARFLSTHKPVCFKCKQFGHYSSSCPTNYQTTNYQYPRQTNSQFQNSNTMPPFRSPQRSANEQRFPSPHSRPVQCFFYNSHGTCTKPGCPYPHVCTDCRGPHPKMHCPGRSKHH